MRSANVYMHGEFSGILEELEPQKRYRFRYLDTYTGESAWIDYFGIQRLGLNREVIIEELSRLTNAFDRWTDLIQKSFMANTAKELYLALLSNRRSVLGL